MTDRESDRLRPTLDEAIAELPRELTPERDLWPAIAGTLPSRRQWSSMPSFATAAVLACVAVVGWQLFAGGTEQAPIELVDAPRLEQPMQALPSDFIVAEAGFSAAREQLSADLEARLEALPPENRAVIERSLETIAAALEDLRGALAEEPQDPVLQHLLLNLHSQELAVLGQIERSTRMLHNQRIEL